MIIKVKVKPRSKKTTITKISNTEFEVRLKEKAENNRANIELINLLSKYFNVLPNSIKIKNPKSRIKLVEIR